MSAKFFQQDSPCENQFIKCNDITCRGHVVISEYATVGGNLTVTGAATVDAGLKVGTSITHDNIPAANIVQLTSSSTGIPVLSIVTQESDRVTIVLRNVHGANALNGNLHFRFKYELGEVA